MPRICTIIHRTFVAFAAMRELNTNAQPSSHWFLSYLSRLLPTERPKSRRRPVIPSFLSLSPSPSSPPVVCRPPLATCHPPVARRRDVRQKQYDETEQ